jgi:cytochrome c oxidase subunit I
MVASPVPEHNFDEIPTVHAQDDFWHRKYAEDERGRSVRIAATADLVQRGDAKGVHLPSPSYFPIGTAAALPIIGYGVIFNRLIAIPGVLVLLFGVFGWAYEPATEPDPPSMPSPPVGPASGPASGPALPPGSTPTG